MGEPTIEGDFIPEIGENQVTPPRGWMHLERFVNRKERKRTLIRKMKKDLEGIQNDLTGIMVLTKDKDFSVFLSAKDGYRATESMIGNLSALEEK